MSLPRAITIGYLLLFLIAFAIYSIAWPEAPLSAPDTAGYLSAAKAIASGRIDQFLDRTPGYPLLLLATGSKAAPTRLLFYVSLVLYFACVYLIATVLHSAGVSSKVLFVCGVIMLLPPYVQMTASALSETLAAFCLAFAFSMLYFSVRLRRSALLVLASVALAYAALTRPLFEFLAFALAAGLGLAALLRRPNRTTLKRVARDCLLLVSASAVAVGGYSLFNYSKFGSFGMTPLLGYALATRTSSVWQDIPDPGVRRILVSARDAAYAQGRNPDWAVYPAQAELMANTGKSEAELGKYLQACSLSLIRAHPEVYLEAVLRSFAEFWFPTTSKLRMLASARVRLIWYALHWIIIGVLALTFALHTGLGLMAAASRQKIESLYAGATTGWLIAVGILVYTAGISCAVSSGDVRYRQPADILLLAATALGAKTLRDISKSRNPLSLDDGVEAGSAKEVCRAGADTDAAESTVNREAGEKGT